METTHHLLLASPAITPSSLCLHMPGHRALDYHARLRVTIFGWLSLKRFLRMHELQSRLPPLALAQLRGTSQSEAVTSYRSQPFTPPFSQVSHQHPRSHVLDL